MLETIRTLVREKDTCVMATCEGDLPHTSLMTYTAEEDGLTFYFLSRMNTRKVRNLRANPEVSLLIDTREEHLPELRHKAMALTVAGTYLPPRNRDDLLRLKQAFTARHPHLEKFASHGDTTILTVKARSFLLLVGVEEQHFIDLENFSEKSA
ncbi:pyridoxamine 5'-phosphate oxidase family protein [Salidesulfovibrio onnuriiensis]|uniref:pyridoxamine 5'-phosphate oxidase family protein n=1 Tax=Salidesulfovibrio onnuriiensis TaxID=2583823 RepID=UPI00164FBCFD|nr:pyridoxamine 5'-phosphate oxidase family protein [Salidesulfovibrio onnuriiensis]